MWAQRVLSSGGIRAQCCRIFQGFDVPVGLSLSRLVIWSICIYFSKCWAVPTSWWNAAVCVNVSSQLLQRKKTYVCHVQTTKHTNSVGNSQIMSLAQAQKHSELPVQPGPEFTQHPSLPGTLAFLCFPDTTHNGIVNLCCSFPRNKTEHHPWTTFRWREGERDRNREWRREREAEMWYCRRR